MEKELGLSGACGDSRVDDSEVESTLAESPYLLCGLRMLMKEDVKKESAVVNSKQSEPSAALDQSSDVFSPVIPRISLGQLTHEKQSQRVSDAETLSPASEVLCPLVPPTQPRPTDGASSLDDSQTTVDVSELHGERHDVTMTSHHSKRSDATTPATLNPKKVEGKCHKKEEKNLAANFHVDIVEGSGKRSEKREAMAEGHSGAMDTDSTQSSHSGSKYRKNMRQKHEEEMTAFNQAEKHMSKALWQFSIDKNTTNCDYLVNSVKSSKPTLARLSKSLHEERQDVVTRLSGGSKLTKTLKHALKEQAKLLQQRQRRLCDLFALHRQLLTASSSWEDYSGITEKHKAEKNTIQSTEPTIILSEPSDRPPTAKKMKGLKTPPPKRADSQTESKHSFPVEAEKQDSPAEKCKSGKWKSGSAKTTYRYEPNTISLNSNGNSEQLLQGNEKQGSRPHVLVTAPKPIDPVLQPSEPRQYAFGDSTTRQLPLMDVAAALTSDPSCAEVLKAKSEAKRSQNVTCAGRVMQADRVQSQQLVKAPCFPAQPLASRGHRVPADKSEDVYCPATHVTAPLTPKPAVLPDGRRELPSAVAGFLSPGSSVDVTAHPAICRKPAAVSTQAVSLLPKPSVVSMTTNQIVKPGVSNARAFLQPTVLQKKPSDTAQNMGTSEQYPSLREMIGLKIIKPGFNVLSLSAQSHRAYGSLTDSGFIRGSGGEVFRSPMAWCSALLTSADSAKPLLFKRHSAYAKVMYMGKPLSELLSQYTPAQPIAPAASQATSHAISHAASHAVLPGEKATENQNKPLQTRTQEAPPLITPPHKSAFAELRGVLDKCTVLLIDDRELIMPSCKSDAYFNSAEFLDSIDKW